LPPRLQIAHTADLDPSELSAARELMREVFGDELTDLDWEHALGGMHVLLWEDERLVGHGAVVLRRLLYGERALRTGYVEAVAVRADRRREGYGARVMDELERLLRGAYELGALGASEMGAALYASRGWTRWEGETWALTPRGRIRTADEDDDLYVYEVSVKLDPTQDLTCDWREGNVW
jgi:aminoglycoside 2'-N-acetyltransferase I